MEAPTINELRERKKKSEEKENSFQKEYEIPPSETEKETLSDAERDKEIPRGETAKEAPPDVERDNENPPNDDVCPICFGDFNVPCKTNCGHWFCANCVIAFWSHRRKFLPCQCPICSESIRKLTPEASLTLSTDDEVVETLNKVRGYNCLFEGGARCLFLLLHLLLMSFVRFFSHVLRGFYDPDKIIVNYVIARAIALAMTEIYFYFDFDFLTGGVLRVNLIFERCTLGPVLLLCAIGIYRRIVNKTQCHS